ncbi:MAG: hypothetical protein V1737_03010 [Chloroflexota bacterium]
MTLILALACKEGLVIASDGQETFQTTGQPVKREASKLFQLGKSVVWGASGHVGLRQVVQKELDALEKGLTGFDKKPCEELRPRLVRAVVPIMQQAVKEFVPVHANARPASVSLCFSGYTCHEGWILEINEQGHHERHEQRGLCAIGSGDVLAYHACQSLQHVFHQDRTLQQCQALAFRVIDEAINTAAYGLGYPIQMWTVSSNGAKQLSSSELEAIGTTVRAWKEIELNGFDEVFGGRTSNAALN